jgi:hypothetical protein
LNVNEQQTLRNEYSHATKILDDLEEDRQLKILLLKYQHLKVIIDGKLGEFNMDTRPISLQMMDPNCKPIHACEYTVPRSVEKQLQQSKGIITLVNI